MYWFNYFGAAIIIALLIPNVIYGIKCKDGFKTGYANKVLEPMEKVARFGTMFCMICVFEDWDFGLIGGREVYLSVCGGLCLLYYIFWIVCLKWKQKTKLRALSLSIIPSIIFLFSGIALLYIPLIVFAVLFSILHIYLSWKRGVFAQQF